MAELGHSLIKEGITVSTIGLGLGYNEDLMVQLAMRSDGGHEFAENANDLARIFGREFGALTSVLAQKIQVEISCPAGVKILRSLSIDMDVAPRQATTKLNQLQEGVQKYILLEVEIDPEKLAGSEVATATVRYIDIVSGGDETIHGSVEVSLVDEPGLVVQAQDNDIVVDAVEQIAALNDDQTVVFADAGNTIDQNSNALMNVQFIQSHIKNSAYTPSQQLRLQQIQKRAETRVNPDNWQEMRKTIRRDSYQSKFKN